MWYGTRKLHELKVRFVFRLSIQWWLRPLKGNWILVEFRVWKVWDWSSLIHQHSIGLTLLRRVWLGTNSLSFLQIDLWVCCSEDQKFTTSGSPGGWKSKKIGEDCLSGVFLNPQKWYNVSHFWTYEDQRRSLNLAQEISLKIRSCKKKELRIQSYVQ
jgi:hypothetical protein